MQQCQQHHGGIVNIRIMFVGELKRPAAGLQAGTLHRPVALPPALAIQHPVRGSSHRIRISAPHLSQREGCVGRVPDRRNSRLKLEPILAFDEQILEHFDCTGAIRMVIGVVQGIERHD